MVPLPVELLTRHRRITVVGMSATPGKDAHEVPVFLAEHGYDIAPVNPSRAPILGRPAHGSLEEAPKPLGLVAVFRPGPETPTHVAKAIALGAEAIWLPTDVSSSESADLARRAGIPFVEDTCLRTVYQLYIGRRAR